MTGEILTVTQLNRAVRYCLEDHFLTLWIEGEISNFVVPFSGHWYFSLKDTGAQVCCAMFKTQNSRIPFTPKNGMHVIVKAKVSLYEARGDYQLIVEHIEEAGEGKLRQAFETLKKQLAERGLFEDSHKQPLPLFPKIIGVITSATGAAIRDILHVLARRSPHIPIIIYPTQVQGTTAKDQIVQAINQANERQECDVLILARGGGSLEDLWPFNEEVVANAIFSSNIPIVTGIGHEIDFTIADFVADVRAPTPSSAAELITTHSKKILATLEISYARLTRCMQKKLQDLTQTLEWTQKQLTQQHPARRLRDQAQKLDFYEITLLRLQTQKQTTLQNAMHALHKSLTQVSPISLIREKKHALLLNHEHCKNLIQNQIKASRERFTELAATLNTLSPLKTLHRGFSITTDQNNKIITDIKQVKSGDIIHVQLSKGKLNCTVNKS